jgi:acyl-CoA thioester hydrolase
MSRLDRARLENGTYPFHCEVQTRYADLDMLSHINNVAMADILQEGRLRFVMSTDVKSGLQRQMVVAASLIEFATDMLYPDPVQVSVGILDIGRTSFRFGQVARQKGRVGAYAEFVMVTRDSQGPVPIPDEWRAALEGLRIKYSEQ